MDWTQNTVMGTYALSNAAPSLIVYPAALVSVTDGDTQRVLIHPRPGMWIEEKVRLIGLDCPESRTPEGKIATQRVIEWFRSVQPGPPYLWEMRFTLTTHRDKRDKYGRLLGYIKNAQTGEELNQWIIENNLLKPTTAKWTLVRFQRELGIA